MKRNQEDAMSNQNTKIKEKTRRLVKAGMALGILGGGASVAE